MKRNKDGQRKQCPFCDCNYVRYKNLRKHLIEVHKKARTVEAILENLKQQAKAARFGPVE